MDKPCFSLSFPVSSRRVAVSSTTPVMEVETQEHLRTDFSNSHHCHSMTQTFSTIEYELAYTYNFARHMWLRDEPGEEERVRLLSWGEGGKLLGTRNNRMYPRWQRQQATSSRESCIQRLQYWQGKFGLADVQVSKDVRSHILVCQPTLSIEYVFSRSKGV